VPRADVEIVMQEWLRMQTDREELLLADRSRVEQKLRRVIERQYKPFNGVPVRFWKKIEQDVQDVWNIYTSNKYPTLLDDITTHTETRQRITLERLLRTAFFIARGFYSRQAFDRIVPRREFERFTLSNTSKSVRCVLSSGGRWLVQTQREIPGVMSRRYALVTEAWPPRRSEAVLFLPP